MEPLNLFCMFLSVGMGMAAVKPLRKALPALEATPKLTPRFLVAGVCFRFARFTRAQFLPMRR
jgi:hypothetical protein